MKTCPFCAELIQPEAVVCKHCGKDLAVAAQPQTPVVVVQQQAPATRVTVTEITEDY